MKSIKSTVCRFLNKDPYLVYVQCDLSWKLQALLITSDFKPYRDSVPTKCGSSFKCYKRRSVKGHILL